MINVLLVEDDPALAKNLHLNLDLEGYNTSWVQNIKTAIQKYHEQEFDLVILDIGLPDGSDFQFLQKIRESKSSLPIIILTAQTDKTSLIKGLELGASDFVKKPFELQELFARIKSLLNRPLRREPQISYGELIMFVEQRKVIYKEKNFELNRREYDILLHLVEHAESIVSRSSFLTTLDKNSDIFDRTIDSHISHLRARLKQNKVADLKISSIYGVGYRLEKI